MLERPATRPARAPVEALEPRVLLCDVGPDGAHVFASALTTATGVVPADPIGSDTSLPGPGLPERPDPRRTTGLKRVLYVRAAFADTPRHRPQTLGSARNSMAFADAFVRANSYGKTSFRTTFTDTVVLPKSESTYGPNGWGQLRADALAAARALRPTWDFADHDLDVIRFDGGPSPGGPSNGYANTNARGAWLRSDSPRTATHELGHNLGLHHANAWQPADPDAPAGTGAHVEYGNPLNVMGGGSGAAAHLGAYEKNFLGWLPDANVTSVARSGDYTVLPADSPRAPAAGDVYALKVRKDGIRDFWLSTRADPRWADTASLRGLEVGWGAWSKDATQNSGFGAHLLDMTPAATFEEFDYGLPLGRTFSDSAAGAHVTPLARAANGAVDVRVELDSDRATPNANAPDAPTITATGGSEGAAGDAAFPGRVVNVAAGQSLTLSAASRDADGDDLAYAWDFDDGAAGGRHGPGGLLAPGGSAAPAASPPASVRYSAPGLYRVRVTVSDLRGSAASSSLLVRVTGGSPGVPTNVVAGKVVDDLGRPVHGARVGEGRLWAYTDADGAYFLTGLDDSPRTLVARAPGGWSFAPSTFANPLVPGPVTRGADFRGTFVGHHINGTVTTPNSYGVSGVIVHDGTRSALTDALGRFSLPAAPGTHILTFTKTGYGLPNRTVVVDDADVSVNVTADVGSVTGFVRGAPAGLRLTINITDDERTAEAAGSYSLQDVPFGTWNLFATGVAADGRVYNFLPDGFTNPVTVDGPERQVNFVFDAQRRFTIRGRITDGFDPVPGVTVDAVVNEGAGTGSVAATAVTDSEGRYILVGLPASAYVVTAREDATRLWPPAMEVGLTENETGFNFTADGPSDLPPVMSLSPTAGPALVTGTSTLLAAVASDDRDSSRLVYSWRVASAPAGAAAVTFSRNGTNAAAATLATFDRPGVYRIESVATDTRGGRATGEVEVTVASVPASVRVRPQYDVIAVRGTQQFDADVLDQFGLPVADLPAVEWRYVGPAGGGAVDADGTFTADWHPYVRGAVVATADVAVGELAGSATVDVRPAATVLGRHVFYNNSALDGHTPAGLPADDAAIALDKRPLLPGAGRATAANYTGFDKGINGVIVDLDRAWSRTWTAADFEFSVGGGAGGWVPAPGPREVYVRGTSWRGGLVDRVTLVWDDGAIRNTWLRVTVLPTDRTGLPAADVFYFGNLGGDTGDAAPGAASAHVSALDYARTLRRVGERADTLPELDHDRDGILTAADAAAARRNRGAWIELIAADLSVS